MVWGGLTTGKARPGMKSEETWTYIHSERAQMADTWADLIFRPVGYFLLV